MDPQQRPREQSADTLVAWSVVCLALFAVIVYFGYPYNTTLWDWLELLVVPAVLAVGGYLFARAENQRARENVDKQRTLDRGLARPSASTTIVYTTIQ